jgi:hypothetical protein
LHGVLIHLFYVHFRSQAEILEKEVQLQQQTDQAATLRQELERQQTVMKEQQRQVVGKSNTNKQYFHNCKQILYCLIVI